MDSELRRKGNPEALNKAAEKKRKFTEGKLWEAIKRIETNTPIRVKGRSMLLTPSAVAREAEISRGTVYDHSKVIDYIKQKKIEWKSQPGGRKVTLIRDVQDKVSELVQIKKQLLIDKDNLARENYRLQFENDELKGRLQRSQKELKELKDQLPEDGKILRMRK